MNLIPTLLMQMQGFNFGIDNLFILLGLSILEFFNFLTIISFILSVFFNLFNDFILGEIKVFFIQIGITSKEIFKIIFLNCVFFGIFFVFNDLFIVPRSNVFLKKRGLELYKNKVFHSIKPRHVVNVPELRMNVSIYERNKNELVGCLLHVENYLFSVIEKISIEKNKLLMLTLKKSKGKVLINSDIINFTFESAAIEANLDSITIPDKLAFFDLNSWQEVLIRIKIFLVTLLVAFLMFVLIFSKIYLVKFINFFSFIILLANAMGFIQLNWLTFIIIYFTIIVSFYMVIKCLDF
ncbi:hypothetical protein [Alphaproteobacteria bacterium endosymbiont of Tiliacea citrago]|uniref:hypothetical protein n=1 Tax=Alphaproteobacteria bacterium endosymbiont of Tiliacea citrago TaxID=3077944 RepID=UPI00313E977D